MFILTIYVLVHERKEKCTTELIKCYYSRKYINVVFDIIYYL